MLIFFPLGTGELWGHMYSSTLGLGDEGSEEGKERKTECRKRKNGVLTGKNIVNTHQNKCRGTSLVVQWQRLCATKAGAGFNSSLVGN